MKEWFSDISKVQYEGTDSKNPLAFHYYQPEEKIAGKSMKDYLPFAIAFWHSMTGSGADPFGAGTAVRPWDDISDPMDKAKARVDAVFEAAEKMQIPYFCFHDRDIAPEGDTLSETNKNLEEIVAYTKNRMDGSSVNLLWGTANMFSNPRFMHGAATSPNPEVFAYAGAQVKKALESTLELGGKNYVFWGGREGYETLLNTNMQLEQENMARFLHMAVDYAKKIGFTGQFLIEPKPKEPTKHQYDFDAATIMGFLRAYDLQDHFKLNIEVNHATLATHTFEHELRIARINNMLGSVDANQGDLLLGWDTDQFPTNIYIAVLAMYEIIKNGGLGSGGLNFDAKLRRGSYRPEDLFYGHVAGMDTFARGLKIADAAIADGELDRFVEKRYAGYDTGIGKQIVEGKVGLEDLETYALKQQPIVNDSGRQEMLENILNQYMF